MSTGLTPYSIPPSSRPATTAPPIPSVSPSNDHPNPCRATSIKVARCPTECQPHAELARPSRDRVCEDPVNPDRRKQHGDGAEIRCQSECEPAGREARAEDVVQTFDF